MSDDRGMSARRRRETRGRTGSRPAPRVRRSTAARTTPPPPSAPPVVNRGVAEPVDSTTTPVAPSGSRAQAAITTRIAALAGTPAALLPRAELVRVAADASLRAALAMFAGFVGTVAIGLALWAVTPGTDLGAEPAVRAATATYVLAHFGHVGIDGASLTLTPLLLTLLFGLLLAVGPGRSRALGGSVTEEVIAVAGGVVTYTALVVVAAVTLAPSGVGVLGAAVGAFLISTTALGLGVVRRGPQLRAWVTERLPGWAVAGLTAAGAAVLATIAGAGIVFVVALTMAFTTAADLASTLSSGGGDAVGLALAGLAYLPNAVLATIGYATGVGYDIGAGRYSPFGSVPADLPPFPLLAAVPGTTGVSVLGLLALLVPVAAGLVAGAVVLRRPGDRRDRLAAVGVAAVVTGVLGGLLVRAASGGVSGGAWPHIGAIGWEVGPVLALAVLVVAGAWVAAASRGSGPRADTAATAAGGIVGDIPDVEVAGGDELDRESDDGAGAADDADDDVNEMAAADADADVDVDVADHGTADVDATHGTGMVDAATDEAPDTDTDTDDTDIATVASDTDGTSDDDGTSDEDAASDAANTDDHTAADDADAGTAAADDRTPNSISAAADDPTRTPDPADDEPRSTT